MGFYLFDPAEFYEFTPEDKAKICAARASGKKNIRNRVEVLASEQCGCHWCYRIFPPGEITDWTDWRDGVYMTPICPRCGVDCVIALN
jgi:hypothetical protein